MQKAHTKPGIDLADVLGFTIGFCFLPSMLCVMAVLLFTYFERPAPLDVRMLAFKGSALPEAGQDDAAASGAELKQATLSGRPQAAPRC